MSLTTLNTTMKKSVVMSVINSDFHITEVNKSNDLYYTRSQNESAGPNQIEYLFPMMLLAMI